VLGTLFKFAANAFAVDRLRMPVPGEAFDTDLRYVAAKTSIAFKQDRFDTRPRRCQSRGKSAGA